MADTERRLSAVERHLRETASLQQQTDILLQDFIENVNRSSMRRSQTHEWSMQTSFLGRSPTFSNGFRDTGISRLFRFSVHCICRLR